jgi:uncharacterized damage-inducible protein DinB
MYRTTADFIKDWKYESDSTLKVLSNITDESLNKSVGDDVRTISRLAWHITGTISEMMNRTGLSVEGPAEHAEPPSTIKEIIDTYRNASESLLRELQKWNDDDLTCEIPMYGEAWTRGATLMVLITHQAHHRGQLTVLMRLAGLKVPGVYGPAKEEWAAIDLPAMP